MNQRSVLIDAFLLDQKCFEVLRINLVSKEIHIGVSEIGALLVGGNQEEDNLIIADVENANLNEPQNPMDLQQKI